MTQGESKLASLRAMFRRELPKGSFPDALDQWFWLRDGQATVIQLKDRPKTPPIGAKFLRVYCGREYAQRYVASAWPMYVVAELCPAGAPVKVPRTLEEFRSLGEKWRPWRKAFGELSSIPVETQSKFTF